MGTEKPRGVIGMLFGSHSDFVKRIIPLFVLSTIMFCISTIFGFYLGDNVNPVVFEDVISSFPDPDGAGFIEIVLLYAINNITASLLFIVSGLVLGIPPLLFIAFNGFFIGWSIYTYAKEAGFWLVTALLLPHGVIEIPTIIFSAAMGMGLGYQLIHQIRRKGSIRDYLVESFYIFIKRIVPLLIIAAIIETLLSVFLFG